MTENYQKIIKLRKLVYEKEIPVHQVEVGFNNNNKKKKNKKDTYTYISSFLLETNSRRCFLYFLFFFILKYISLRFIYNHMYFRIQQRTKKIHKSRENVCMGITFFDVELYFSSYFFFLEGKRLKLDFPIFLFHRKANRISY